jgi:predicted nuclease of predicted toxin-antitoxin system
VRWLADECVDAGVASSLRSEGHDVIDIAAAAPSIMDIDVARLARDQNRLLLTEDKDFGELVFRLAMPVPGLVLIRISPELRSRKAGRLRTAIEIYRGGLFGRYTVIEPGRLRSRLLHSKDDT